MLTALLDLIPKPLLLALIAALLAMSGWLKVENLNLTTSLAKEQTHAAELVTTIAESDARAQRQKADNERAARAAEQARAQREKTLLADAASVRDELGRLRASLSSAGTGLRVHPTDSNAGPIPVSTDTELLLDCAARYADLGEKADRHLIDLQTLMAAWPK
jgi:hypothetical protein